MDYIVSDSDIDYSVHGWGESKDSSSSYLCRSH